MPLGNRIGGRVFHWSSYRALPRADEINTYQKDFWSAIVSSVTITTTKTDYNISATLVVGSSVHGIPANAKILRAVLMFKFRHIQDSSGADNAVVSDATGAGWFDLDVTNTNTSQESQQGYRMVDGSFFINGGTNSLLGGDFVMSNSNLENSVGQDIVTGAATYTLDFENASADGNNLIFRDFQWGLRVWYEA